MLNFQITYWDSVEEYDNNDELVYKVRLFGLNRENQNVCLKVENFNPFF